MTKWSNTKRLGLAIEKGEDEASFGFDLEEPGCKLLEVTAHAI
jgi:hypothetical protein